MDTVLCSTIVLLRDYGVEEIVSIFYEGLVTECGISAFEDGCHCVGRVGRVIGRAGSCIRD